MDDLFVCNQCCNAKLETDFGFKRNGDKQTRCIKCRNYANQKIKKYYLEHSEQRKEYAKEYYQEQKRKLMCQ